MRSLLLKLALVTVSTAILIPLWGQTSKPDAKGSTAPPQSTGAPLPGITAPPSSQASTKSPTKTPSEAPADYIPCVFTQQELLGLRLQPVSSTLTSKDDEDLKEELIIQAKSTADKGQLSQDMVLTFVQLVSTEVFEGLTPSQALGRVIDIIRNAAIEKTVVESLESAAQNKNVDQLVSIAEQQLPMETLWKEDPHNDLKTVDSNLRSGLTKDMTPLDLLIRLRTNVSGSASGVYYDHPELNGAIKPLLDKITAAMTNLKFDLRAVRPAEASTPGDNRSLNALNALNDNQMLEALATQEIVDSARRSLAAAFQRPQDVGCAMSIISWNETRYAFGRIIANEYIGVQIVVRNLNDKQEFALHDAELSVDTDINGRYGRFYSGRDKLVVRGLSLAQADFTPRNFVVHLAEAVGTVMSAALPVAGTTFKDATGVYNGGFLPGFKTIWADHTVQQLNLLSDIGFSSSTNYKTVVPKSGTVMFVIFIPSKQFDEGWWVQSCAEHISINPNQQATSPTGALRNTNKAPTNSLGIDLESARRLCTKYGVKAHPPVGPEGKLPKAGQAPNKQAGNVQDSSQTDSDQSSGKPPNPTGAVTQNATILSVDDVPFRKWSPIALSIFRELAWAVVAGTHIQETQNQSAITELKCPTDDLGNILFNKTGTLSCDLSGEGLDKVATLRLRNAQDATDTDTADGPVTVSGDATKAKVTFQLSKLGGLNKPAYKVYAVTTTGIETFANQTLHFDLNPYETDISPTSPDPNKDASIQFTLKGFHLDKITKVEFFENAYSKDGKPVLQYDLNSGVTANQASFTLKSADDDLKKKASDPKGETLQIVLPVKNSASVVPADTITLKSPSPSSLGSPKSVSLSVKNLTFGAQSAGTKSTAQAVTLTNSAATGLEKLTFKVTGIDANRFAVEDSKCGVTVEAGGKCAMSVVFAPTAAKKLTAILDIGYTLAGAQETQSVALVGTGNKTGLPSSLTTIPKSLAFEPQKKGTKSAAKTVKLTNSRAATMSDFAVNVVGAKAKNFSQTSTCGSTIAAGATCTLALTFSPDDKGKLSATVNITFNVAGLKNTQSLPLTGTSID
jgi:hypothetical protein